MKIIKNTLDVNPDILKVYIFSDWHIGDTFADLSDIEALIKKVVNDPDGFVICNGDLMNNATKLSVSDSYAELIPPMQQVDMLVKLLTPVKDKILCLTQGNHEARTYITDGIDLTQIVAVQLGIEQKYSKEAAFIPLRFGCTRKKPNSKICYTIYCTHGTGGGRKEGSKVIQLADMANIVDADIYVHSHSHLPFVMKEDFNRFHSERNSIEVVTKLFVNSSAKLKYGGYGEGKEYKPSSKDCPVIYLSNFHKKSFAML